MVIYSDLMVIYSDSMVTFHSWDLMAIYLLVNLCITMENHRYCATSMAIFNCYVELPDVSPYPEFINPKYPYPIHIPIGAIA